jgi:N-acetyl-gamma-glutamylphosphate reductase
MRSKKIFIAGQEGMVGKAIYKLLKKKNSSL